VLNDETYSCPKCKAVRAMSDKATSLYTERGRLAAPLFHALKSAVDEDITLDRLEGIVEVPHIQD